MKLTSGASLQTAGTKCISHQVSYNITESQYKNEHVDPWTYSCPLERRFIRVSSGDDMSALEELCSAWQRLSLRFACQLLCTRHRKLVLGRLPQMTWTLAKTAFTSRVPHVLSTTRSARMPSRGFAYPSMAFLSITRKKSTEGDE